ncbi:disintegrin and metalloproteinase domain-containing protein 9 [Synchiropus splendidus]|uniref:disintegrin and metalloproteinase domain-containing protein 9 n=1 Tax=Synchiropus splendidus TaxID=270530 RepID=UPI00237DA16A|nr:disintegrin and metalloproteinase domain-containing protein 9 [Synchiropus splendidus]
MIGIFSFLAISSVCFVSGLGDKDNVPPLQLSKYSLIQPQVVRRSIRSIQSIPEEDSLSYDININGSRHRLHLTINRDFLHPKFLQHSYGAKDKDESVSPKQVHCYYHGEVEGYEDSMVALSTCSGLRGVIFFRNEGYGIEPMRQSDTNIHFLYRLEDVQSEAATCGVVHDSAESHEPFNQGESLTSLLRRRRNLPQTSFVELVLVVDNLRYKYKKENEVAVREEMVEMANLLDGYYKKLNIRIMLVGLEIFKTSNPFSLEGSPGNILGAFVKWRKQTLLPKIRHDVAQLIIGRPNSFQGVLGMAFVGTVCSATSSGGINVFGNDNLVFASSIVAHELGHNLGMSHDNTRCNCEGKPCIMASSTSSATTTFSTCSGQDFERLIQRGGGICLKNQPEITDVVGVAQCGNGMLEEGEQCDCGTPKECKNKCCNAATCKLTPGSACAHGSCCNNCQVRVAGTQCRGSADTCDLPEYCNGTSAFCPDDYYLMDGLPCQNDAAYCYEGRCQTYDYQCRRLFVPDPAKKAADICFTHANTRGNLFGNCGIDSSGRFIKCSVANAMCGKVQCTNVDVNNPPPDAHVSIQIVDGSTCVNADFNLGPDVLDPAYVNPGSPCAKGKTCIDFTCVNASALLPNFKCDAKTTCNGRGVCNDQGHCHCKDGWAPPYCKQPGRGGSIESGPAQIDHSLRNGLLIFFFLVVPILVLLILVLLFIFKRDSLDPCLKRDFAQRVISGNTKRQPDVSNVEKRSSAPQHVPGRTDYPPATDAPISDFRYGELDYRGTEPTGVPVRQPMPRQGPGVPRPIPPKQLN